MKILTVIIPTYNRPNLALSLASKIRRFREEIEIIIVDQNNSSPPEKKELEKLKVKYFNLKKDNTSVAKNKGIEESKGEIIFFFDDDVEVTKATLENNLKFYTNPEVVGVSGRVINDGEKIPKLTDVITGKTDFLGLKFLWQYWSTKKQFIDFPYGCNMSFRKEALLKAKGFDKRFPKIFEEIDLGVRISKKLGKIMFAPDSLVYHHKAKTGGTRSDEKNKQIMIYSHYGTYIAKNVLFPFSVLTLLIRTITILKSSPYALKYFTHSYFSYFLGK